MTLSAVLHWEDLVALSVVLHREDHVALSAVLHLDSDMQIIQACMYYKVYSILTYFLCTQFFALMSLFVCHDCCDNVLQVIACKAILWDTEIMGLCVISSKTMIALQGVIQYLPIFLGLIGLYSKSLNSAND